MVFPPSPFPFWQYFDFITIGLLFVVITSQMIFRRRKTGSLQSSISQTVAATRRSSLIFSVAMTILFPLYYAFLWLWLGPLIQAPAYYYHLLIASGVCEMTFVWAPATIGRSKKIHEIMAGVVGLAMLALPLVILLSGNNLNRAAIVGLIIFLLSSATLAVLLTIQKLRRFTLLYETVYCLTFLIAISITAHVG